MIYFINIMSDNESINIDLSILYDKAIKYIDEDYAEWVIKYGLNYLSSTKNILWRTDSSSINTFQDTYYDKICRTLYKKYLTEKKS